MPKRLIDLREQQPILDVVSYARGGRRLTPQQREQILLTVRRGPEVMVKVSGGAHTLAGVQRHMKYIGREGELGMETDLGTRIGGAHFERDLTEDWDLDLETLPRQSERGIRNRRPGKLVHNLIFSMPPGTPPQKVLEAVRRLAVNEWHLRHRYALALHTDTSHPHVHVVLKAVSEQGERLNIRKATLRSWRSEFARHLRELGLPANATERAVRGKSQGSVPAGGYRTALREQLRGMFATRDQVLAARNPGRHGADTGVESMRRTRAEVVTGWQSLASIFRKHGDAHLSDEIRTFTRAMDSVVTERERVADELGSRGTECQGGHSREPQRPDRTY